jgi:hypothetical protein
VHSIASRITFLPHLVFLFLLLYTINGELMLNVPLCCHYGKDNPNNLGAN